MGAKSIIFGTVIGLTASTSHATEGLANPSLSPDTLRNEFETILDSFSAAKQNNPTVTFNDWLQSEYQMTDEELLQQLEKNVDPRVFEDFLSFIEATPFEI